MKKTILVSLAGLALFLAGCTQQAPTANQNLNQPAANINQNVNQPTVNVNQNLNQPAVNQNLDQPTAKPTVNLRVEPSEISKGESATLTWSTENSVTCEASSPTAPDPSFKLNWQGSIDLSGTRVYENIPHDLIFELTCKNAKGDSTFASTIVRAKSIADMATIKIYFGNAKIKSVYECNEVVPVTRTIPKTEKIGTAALNELLKGPTPEEKAQGYGSSIPAGSKLNSLVIVNGEARADFNDITESGGGSCSMRMRVTQIHETLLQFPTVKTVKISINGRTEYIFQP